MTARLATDGSSPVVLEGGPGDRVDHDLKELVGARQGPARERDAANGAGGTTIRGGGLNITHKGKAAGKAVGEAQGEKAAATAAAETPSPPSPRSGGLVLGSVGRDLAFEATLVEKLGRLVCEGALIEVVDVHKEVGAQMLRDYTTF